LHIVHYEIEVSAPANSKKKVAIHHFAYREKRLTYVFLGFLKSIILVDGRTGIKIEGIARKVFALAPQRPRDPAKLRKEPPGRFVHYKPAL